MKVALTGASGFVGRYVLAELSRMQIKIVAVTRDARKLLFLPPCVHVVERDISLPWQNCFAQMGYPDVLIHLAWDGLPNYRALHHFDTELPRQYRFLENLVNAGLSSVFVAGTCLEYGMQSGPLSEDIRPCPTNPYGYAKDALRQQLEFLKTIKNFNLVWARLFYMYGEGQSGNSLYSMLKEAILRGDNSFNMSGGEQLRDYLPVAEVAREIVRFALSGLDVGTVNICSGKPISIRRLVEQWLVDNNWEITLNLGYYPYPDYEPMAFWGDIAKNAGIFKGK
ncbi:NAD-dependent epimerase/dehydratase family protein [Thiovibrio frasassiensis]|uniref:NAD(P)-dependent oxidoreductase n=1 Tax=Thiovibrio frasassiensis TaxID=2984131 RepID=A0A9X4RP32_9BACT|nr:NAD(P)-dependent oxidoreductase [Thiovibrio frasassiensis]MDG4474802.1 NAD(P)-dependent oxidoreductase [Thiovibrio frasassiensis]